MSYNKITILRGVGGMAPGWKEALESVAMAGRPIVVASYDDYGVVGEALAIADAYGVPVYAVWKEATLPANPEYSIPPTEAGTAYWHMLRAKIPPEFDRDRVWLAVFNEGRKEHEWGDWWGRVALRVAQHANAEGYRVLCFGWSAGTPDVGANDSGNVWTTDGMTAFLRYCADNYDRCGIHVHEGADPSQFDAAPGDVPLVNNEPYITGRYAYAFARCQELGILTPRVFITECAWKYNEAAPIAVGFPQVVEAAEYYAQHPEVMGVALWYAGTANARTEYGNVAKSIAPYIGPLATLSISDRFDGVPVWPDGAPHYMEGSTPPPPPPVHQYRKTFHLLPQDATRDEVDEVLDGAGAYTNRNTITFSSDDALGLAAQPNTRPDSVAYVWHPSRWDTTFIDELSQHVDVRPRYFMADTSDRAIGVDVSHHQPAFPWGAFVHEIDFAIIRHGDGVNTYDTQYRRNVEECQRLGIPFGVYHYMRPGNISEQVDKFAQVLGDNPDLPAFLDVEQPGIVPDEVARFIDLWHERCHWALGVYSSQALWQELAGDMDPDDAPLWIASWTANDSPHLPPSWSGWDFWQYTTANPWPELWPADKLDVNRFNGNTIDLWDHMAQLAEEWGAPPEPPPPQGPAYDLAEYMAGKPGVQHVLQHEGRHNATEPVETQFDGNDVFTVKGGGSEHWWFDGHHVYRGVDTSQSADEFYAQYTGDETHYGCAWMPRWVRVGDSFTVTAYIEHYAKSDCRLRNHGHVTSTRRVVAHLDAWQPDGSTIVVDDVLVLEWSGGERYYYGRGMGLVGFEGKLDGVPSRSYIVEVHRDRAPLPRQIPACWGNLQ